MEWCVLTVITPATRLQWQAFHSFKSLGPSHLQPSVMFVTGEYHRLNRICRDGCFAYQHSYIIEEPCIVYHILSVNMFFLGTALIRNPTIWLNNIHNQVGLIQFAYGSRIAHIYAFTNTEHRSNVIFNPVNIWTIYICSMFCETTWIIWSPNALHVIYNAWRWQRIILWQICSCHIFCFIWICVCSGYAWSI